jgi:SpoVK/Ycf46/Vps4 family AAA+-type ATPase
MKEIMRITEGYSCADMQAVIKEAAMFPVRELAPEDLLKLKDSSAIRKIGLEDFKNAVKNFAPSVSKQTIKEFDNWRKDKGQA